MRTQLFCTLIVAAQCWVFTASGHRGSGMVVDAGGNVYFTYHRHGVAKIDPQGKLTYVGHTRGGHWLCLDVMRVRPLKNPFSNWPRGVFSTV